MLVPRKIKWENKCFLHWLFQNFLGRNYVNCMSVSQPNSGNLACNKIHLTVGQLLKPTYSLLSSCLSNFQFLYFFVLYSLKIERYSDKLESCGNTNFFERALVVLVFTKMNEKILVMEHIKLFFFHKTN